MWMDGATDSLWCQQVHYFIMILQCNVSERCRTALWSLAAVCAVEQQMSTYTSWCVCVCVCVYICVCVCVYLLHASVV